MGSVVCVSVETSVPSSGPGAHVGICCARRCWPQVPFWRRRVCSSAGMQGRSPDPGQLNAQSSLRRSRTLSRSCLKLRPTVWTPEKVADSTSAQLTSVREDMGTVVKQQNDYADAADKCYDDDPAVEGAPSKCADSLPAQRQQRASLWDEKSLCAGGRADLPVDHTDEGWPKVRSTLVRSRTSSLRTAFRCPRPIRSGRGRVSSPETTAATRRCGSRPMAMGSFWLGPRRPGPRWRKARMRVSSPR